MCQAGARVWFAFASAPSGARALYSVAETGVPAMSGLADFVDVRAVGCYSSQVAIVGFQPAGGERWVLATYEDLGSAHVLATLTAEQFVPRGSSIVAFDAKLYFPMGDVDEGIELWAADAASGALVRLTELSSGTGSSLPSHVVQFSHRLIFRTDSPSGAWTFDPNGAGVAELSPSLGSGSRAPACLVVQSARLICSAELSPSTGVELVALRPKAP
jgi:ELWxxDGT repeat protein